MSITLVQVSYLQFDNYENSEKYNTDLKCYLFVFKFTMQLYNLAEAMRYMVFIVAQMFHLFCFSFQGQKLINHSLETCDKM